MRRIVIMVDGGNLTGVFTDGDIEEIMVELIDYDNLNISDEPEELNQAYIIETEIKEGKLKSCW